MPYTIDSLREDVIRHLDAHNDPNFVDSFPSFVRQCEERIYQATKIQPFRQDKADGLDAGVNAYTLPDNWVRMISITAGNPSTPAYRNNLIMKQTDWIIEAIPLNTQGLPLFYTLHTANNGKPYIMIWPIEGRATSLTLYYYGKPPSLADTAAPGTTWLSVNAETTLLQGTLYYAYISEKGEDDISARYAGEFDKGLMLLRNVAREGRIDEFRSSPQAAPEA
jgi:hypothetical protein